MVSIDEMIGHLTSIMSVTRESGNIAGNSLKSIYARIQTNSSATSALEAIGIALTNVDGSAKSSSELLGEVAAKWDGLSDAQRRSTSVGIAGIYQLSRFNALLNNYSIAVDATTTSLNSQGSAMREQEKYNQSLEARINKLSTAWYNLAATVGDTILYDAIVVSTQLLTNFTNTGEQGARSLSVLPPILATIGLGTLLLSTRFRALTVAVATNGIAMTKSAFTFKLANISAQSLAFSLLKLRAAFTGLLMATGVGVIFAGIGVAIEFLTRKISDNIQKNEEFQLAQEKTIAAVTDNEEVTLDLIETYNRLSEAKEKNKAWNSDKEREYLQVQQQLADSFPALIAYVDATGQAHLKSKEAIEKELKVAKELAKENAKATVDSSSTTYQSRLDDIEEYIKDADKLRKKIGLLQSYIDEGTVTEGTKEHDDYISSIRETEQEINLLQNKIHGSSQQIQSDVLKTVDAFAQINEIDIDSGLMDDVANAMLNVDFSKMNADEITEFEKEISKLTVSMQEALSNKDFSTFNALSKEMEELVLNTDGYNKALGVLAPNYEKLIEASNNFATSLTHVNEAEDESGEYSDKLAAKMNDLIESMTNYKDIAEEMSGVTQATIDNSNELLTTYDYLTQKLSGLSELEQQELLNKKNLTAEEEYLVSTMAKRQEVMNLLSVLYPDLLNLQENAISLTGEQIAAVEDELYANQVLHESYKNLYGGKYNSEQAMTLASKDGTEARISNLNAEIRALQVMVKAYDNMYRGLMSTAGTSDPEVHRFMEREASKAQAATARISELSASVTGLRGNLKTTYQQLDKYNTALGGGTGKYGGKNNKSSSGGGSGGSSGSGGGSGSSSSSKNTLNEAIYLADTLAIALERVNAEIERQELLRSEYPEYANTYIKSLETQRKLEKDKLDILRQQAKQLQSQIDAEKFLQTGKVVTNKDTKVSKSEADADRQEAVEKARSELLKLQQDILQQEKMLNSVEKMIVDSNISKFNHRRNETDKLLATESVRLKELSINSKAYNDTLQKSSEYMLAKQRVNREELIYLTSVVRSNKLYGQSLQEVNDRIYDLKLEMRELVLEIQEKNYEIIINIKTQFEDNRSDTQYEFDRLTKMQESLNEGTNAWLKLQKQKLELQKQESKTILNQRDALQREILNRDLTAEKIREMKEGIQSLTLSYYDSINAEKELSESLVNVQKSTSDSIASSLWDAYQEYVEQRSEEHMKMIDNQIKSEQDAHNKRMKQLDDEMNLFRKNVQERIALIDKTEVDRDYNMGMGDLRTERESLLTDFNALMLDNSREAEKRRRDIQEKLDAIDKDIAERQRDREIELQKEALNSLVETKEESINYQKDLETQRYEAVTATIDREKEYWEKHYQDLANDERKYAQLREDIMNGNWSKITLEFGNYIDQMKDTMPELADTMDGTMQSVGTAIRENVITNLQEAIQLLREFQSQQAISTSFNGKSPTTGGTGVVSGGNGSNTGSKTGISGSDMKVLLGKYMYENLAKNETDTVTRDFILQKAQALAKDGRTSGSKLTNDYDLSTYISQLNKDDLEMFAKFVESNSKIVVDSPHLQEYLKEFAKRLLLSSARLSSGGMIPNVGGLGLDGKGGRGLIVHPNEIVNSPYDTDNLVNMSKILQTAVSYLNPLINKLTGFTPNNANGGDGGINVEVYIEKVIGDETSGKHIGNGIANTLKTKFGRSFK